MGLFSKEEEGDFPCCELTPEMEAKIDELARYGNQLEEEFYSETVWFLAAIGDVYFQKGMYSQAHECFDKARGNVSGEGYQNPFIMFRLGECCLEIGDEKNALEYLLRAWLMEGEDIFEPDDEGEDDGRKYFDFLRTHIDLGKEEG